MNYVIEALITNWQLQKDIIEVKVTAMYTLQFFSGSTIHFEVVLVDNKHRSVINRVVLTQCECNFGSKKFTPITGFIITIHACARIIPRNF